MNSKKQRFYFHYNKPESKKQGRVIWSVHWNKTCFLVDEIKCNVPCESKTNKRQPFAVMQGWCENLNVAYLTPSKRIEAIIE